MTTYISWIRDDELLDLLDEGDVTPHTFNLLRGDVDGGRLSDSRNHILE